MMERYYAGWNDFVPPEDRAAYNAACDRHQARLIEAAIRARYPWPWVETIILLMVLLEVTLGLWR